MTNNGHSELGLQIGNPGAPRIIAVSTSGVFLDASLIKDFWKVNSSAIDSGLQGHLYTRPGDVFVIKVPQADAAAAEKITAAIDINARLWRSLTGIELSTAADPLVLCSDHALPSSVCLPENIKWFRGRLLDAAVAEYQAGHAAFLAFIFNEEIAEKLGLGNEERSELYNKAKSITLLMNKNEAMQLIRTNIGDSIPTYLFNKKGFQETALQKIPPGKKYVFKPSGGAAGIGVFSKQGRGATLEQIREYIRQLEIRKQLPQQFQVQEFVEGMACGASAYFENKNDFRLLEFHRQLMSEDLRCVGISWSALMEKRQIEKARMRFRQLAAIKELDLAGLICLDLIEGKIIEVNPRLTSAGPIIELLGKQQLLALHPGIALKQIDIRTNISIPFEMMQNGALEELIKQIWQEHQVLVLPQGLNPFGKSRMVFINDRPDNSIQQLFIKELL